MFKKNRKIFSAFACFIIVLSFAFFFLPSQKISAANLEVQYPQIAGKTLTGTSKLPDYAIYLFNAGMFLGFFSVFISLIVAGAMYMLSPAKPDLRASAKERVTGAISGLLILVLTYLIITTINSQLAIFRFNEPEPSPPPAPTEEKKSPGAYFYSQSDCSNTRIQPYTSNVEKFDNTINSASIVQDTENQTAYISILYENPGFWGKCQYINPNINCASVSGLTPSSASIYKYDFKPDSDGVYFFRKACFNKIDTPYSSPSALVSNCKKQSDGFLRVPNSAINNIYVKKLDELTFTNVPEDQQDCTKYDENGECVKGARKAPTLGGENISSIIVNGDYIVLLVYFDPKKDSAMSWSSCQEFPSFNDVNKIGPQQVKWERIRNSNSIIPNYAVIIPIQR